MSGVPSMAGSRRSRLSKPNGPGKEMTRRRRIPKFPAPTKTKAKTEEKVESKEYVGNAALTKGCKGGSKGAYPIPAAWNSWRPLCSQWRSFIPRPWQSKGKGKHGKGQKGKGKGDVEMGGAGYVGQDYDYSYYDTAGECWNGGLLGSFGCLEEWPGLTPNDSAQTLEVITPLLKD